LLKDARKLQDITSRLDPPAIWTEEPAQVTVVAKSLKGFVFNPLNIQVYYYYTMHR